ncbi:MAG: hypothetical protein AB8B63_13700 [Granulosicoccus sp.]
MPQAPIFNFLPDPRVPLRDALRGMTGLSRVAHEVLNPATSGLPEPFRSKVGDALNSFTEKGERLVSTPVTEQQIAKAAQFVTGVDQNRDAAESCARVICYCWQHIHDTALSHKRLISETLLISLLQKQKRANCDNNAQFGAQLIREIRNFTAVGLIPGLVGNFSSEGKNEVDLALIAILSWLMSERADSMAEEEKLLDLSLALVFAVRADALSAIEQDQHLAELLENVSGHL